MEETPGVPSVSNMADGNRSACAKGKSVLVVDYEVGSTSSHNGSQSHGDFISYDGSSHGDGSRAAAVDRHDHDDGYVAHLPTTNFDDNNGISSSSSSLPLTVAPTYHEYVDPGYYYYGPTTGHGGGTGCTASFPASPFSGGAAGVPGPQHHVRTAGNQQFTGIGSSSTQHHYELYHSAKANVVVGATFASPHIGDDGAMHNAPHHAHAPNRGRSRAPLPWSMEQIDSFIGNSLRSLTIRDDHRLLFAHARSDRRRLSSELVNNIQQEPRDLAAGTDDDVQNNNPRRGRGVDLTSNAADHEDRHYVGKRLDDVRGAMSSVARTTPGCRFLVRMVAEGGADAARQVLGEVAEDVVRLMVHADGHALVEALVQYLTDEDVARVLQSLDAASPAQIVAVARNHQGSNILQPLIGRIAGNPGHEELLTRTLARVGERGVLSLMEDMDGSHLIMRCLDTFSAAHNQFITVAMAMSVHRVCRDRHGCHVMNKLIDMAGVDAQMWSSLVHAVCWDGFALAEHGYGNYVVQHVLRCVPQARATLHAAFRGRYVSLSTQMASSHVVQRCLELFSPEQADEIVGELLGCHHHHHWGSCTFQQLISDRFANFVLQTAMERTEIQMHNRLLDAITVHSGELRENMFARNIYRKLCTLRRIYRLSRRATW